MAQQIKRKRIARKKKKQVNSLLNLPNGCYTGKISVHPSNWKCIGASLDEDWYIYYRYHDPELKHIKEYKYGKLIVFKGMNEEKDLEERRLLVADLIEAEKRNLKSGWHPIKRKFVRPPDFNHELNPDTPFIKALRVGLSKVKAVQGTLTDMASVVNGVEKAAIALDYHELPISTVSMKYFKRLFEHCYATNKRFSNARHNKYRAYLIKIYKQLVQYEAVESIPLRDIEKEKETRKERVVLTLEERRRINQTLYNTQYYFWRALQIFFHSGARETELMKVQGKHVDLVNQRVKYIVLKGPNREIRRPIKDIALPFWQEIMETCKPEEYVFSDGLIPGPKPIRPDQLGRRWALHVKKKLNIDAGLYSLKHSNTTEVVDLLSDEDAAKLNGHTSTAMVRKIYDTGREERQNKRIQGLNNQFAG